LGFRKEGSIAKGVRRTETRVLAEENIASPSAAA